MNRNNFLSAENGFTLIEMMVVVAVACLIVPLSFLTFSRLSDEQTMENFVEQCRDVLSNAQMTALADSSPITVTFDNSRHLVLIDKNTVTFDSFSFDKRMTVEKATHDLNLVILKNGHFQKPGSLFFILGQIKYKLVILLGQGRFYFEKQ